MSPGPDEQLPVSLARLEGKVDTLAAEVRAGDKQSGQLVKLLEQQLAYLTQALDEVKAAVVATRQDANTAASTVRVDLERQLTEHCRSETPHPNSSLAKDLDGLKDAHARLRGALVVVGLFVPIGVAAAGRALGL